MCERERDRQTIEYEWTASWWSYPEWRRETSISRPHQLNKRNPQETEENLSRNIICIERQYIPDIRIDATKRQQQRTREHRSWKENGPSENFDRKARR